MGFNIPLANYPLQKAYNKDITREQSKSQYENTLSYDGSKLTLMSKEKTEFLEIDWADLIIDSNLTKPQSFYVKWVIAVPIAIPGQGFSCSFSGE
jgi:hypothetical protein